MSIASSLALTHRVWLQSILLFGLLAAGEARAAVCDLYPIAMPAAALTNVAPNTTLGDIYQGTQSGNFGWLTWGGSPSEQTLTTSLRPLGNSATYINPDNTADHVLTVGRWALAKPGVSNSKTVQEALNSLTNLDITVPVWDQTRGQGDKAAYRVSAFARIRLLSYALPATNRITARFLGYVTCGAQNQPPTVDAGPDKTLTLPATGMLTGSATDDGLPAGGTLATSWSAVSGPGTVTFANVNATNTAASFSEAGTYLLRLSATDGELASSDVVVVTVNRPNDAPVANSQSAHTDEDLPLEITLTGSDPDGDALSFVVTTTPSYGTLSGTPPNLRYTPKPDYNGPDNFSFKVNDGLLDSAAATINLNIQAVNDPPTADAQAVEANEDTPLAITLSGADIEGSSMTYSVVQSPTHGALSGVAPRLVYTPNANYNGTDSFTFQINDGALDSASATVTLSIESVDDSPVVEAGPDYLISLPNHTVNLAGSVIDDYFAGQAPLILWTKVNGPGDVTFADVASPTTAATLSAPGVYALRLTARDVDFVVTDDVNITFNAPPAVNAGADQTITLPDDATLNAVVTDDGLPSNSLIAVAWTKLSGPGSVVFSDPQSTNITAAFSKSGIYVLRLGANDGSASSGDDVTVLVNQTPIVDAGSEQLTTNLTVTLHGTAVDDDLPTAALGVNWAKVSGPGGLTFSDPTSATSTATFSQPGVYLLRLTADDSLAATSAEVVIAIDSPPAVDAGPDQLINFPAAATLNATASDDGLPPNAVISYQWVKVSGPGTVTFSQPTTTNSQPTTSAIFSAPGVYVLRLTADDTLLSGSDQTTIVVNQAPVISSGANQTINFGQSALLNCTVTDDGLPSGSLNYSWSQVAGPGQATFVNPNAPNTSATFSLPGVYTLRLSASDTGATNTAELIITVNQPAGNLPPVVNVGADQIVRHTNATVLHATMSDDGLPIGQSLSVSWSQSSGPGTAVFDNPHAADTRVTFSAAGVYVLRMEVNDSSLTGTDEVVIKVYPDNQPPTADAGPDQTLVLSPQVTTTTQASGPPVVHSIRDSRGRDFWVGFPANYTQFNYLRLFLPVLTMFIASETDTTGTVAIPGLNFYTNFTVTAGTVAAIEMPSSAELFPFGDVENKGIHVTTTDEVTVYGLSNSEYISDAFLGLPTDALGTEYIVVSYASSIVDGPGTQFAVVGTEDNTTVTITLTADTTFHPGSIPYFQSGTDVTWLAGVPYSITLNQGQTFHLRNNQYYDWVDFTGTRIVSDKPVAVYGGHLCARVPVTKGGCNYLVEQEPPTTTWGRSFVTMPFATRHNGDTFRFLAATNNTHVQVNGTLVATLNTGQFYEQMINGPARINSDQPILVMQYSNGGDFDGNPYSDPFMVTVPPFEQFLNSYTLATPTTYWPPGGLATNFVNVVAPTAAAGLIQIDGAAISATNFVPIGASGFSGAQVRVGHGSHDLSGPVPFGVTAYGFGIYDGYGYAGGMAFGDVADISEIVISPGAATNRVATEQCVAATVLDSQQLPLAGVRVDFRIAGANTLTGFAFSDGNGLARFWYAGANAGADSVLASVGEVSANATRIWSPLPALTLNGSVTDDGMPAGGTLTRTWSQVSGPGTVNFANATADVTPAQVSVPGQYLLRLTGNDSEFTAGDEVAVTVLTNQPPTVDAGADQIVNLPAEANLNGWVQDDGVPGGVAPAVYWSQISGPALSRILDPTAAVTTASFTLPGVYVFRLGANDSLRVASDEVSFTVQAPPMVRITSPETDSLFQEGTDVLLLARAKTQEGVISKVAFFVGAEKLGETTHRINNSLDAPFSLVWTDAFPGTNDLTAVALNSQGLSSTSAPVRIVINARPVVSFAGPTNIVFEHVPSALTLNVNASDVDGVVKRVSLLELVPNAYGYTVVASFGQRTNPPFTFELPSVQPATRIYYAVAEDDRGGASDAIITMKLSAIPQVAWPVWPLSDGALLSVGRPLELRASVATYDAEAAQVEFLADGASLGIAELHPVLDHHWYQVWENPPRGDFTLTVKATDTLGRVGMSQPIAVHLRVPPTVQFTSPTPDTVLDYGQALVLSASAQGGDSPVQVVEFYSDYSKVGEATASSGYTFRWAKPPVGTSTLTAMARDAAGLYTESAPVQLTVRPFLSAAPHVRIASPTNHASARQNSGVDVRAYFGDSDGYVAKVQFFAGTNQFDQFDYDPSFPQTSYSAFWFAAPLGNHLLTAVATDNSGTMSTSAPVAITVVPAPPEISIGNPNPEQAFSFWQHINVSGYAYDPDGQISRVEVYLDGVKVGEPEAAGVSFHLTLPSLGIGSHTLSAIATDDSGLRTTAGPLRIRVGNLESSTPVGGGLSATNEGRIITAPTPIFGTITNLFPTIYTLNYRLKTPDDSGQWTTFKLGYDDVIDGPLGIFDPTLLLNGTYEINLSAYDYSGASIDDTTTVIVEGNMKIGHFTLSFNDLTVPVAGIPIQIIRTYDSRAAAAGIQGDFGPGWTLDLKNIRLQKNGPLGQNWQAVKSGTDFPRYELDPVRQRLVTITFPNGRLYKFRFEPNPMQQLLVPIAYPRWHFTPLPGTTGTLVPASYDEPDGQFLASIGSWPADEGASTVDLFDLNYLTGSGLTATTEELYAYPTLFRFTTLEGYSYLIDEKDGLQSVTDPNGNTLKVNSNGLTWTNSVTGGSSLSVAFQRDDMGRITNITDTAGHTMQYQYDWNDDLVAFIDREGHTNTFTYDYNHYLLALTDARGVTPMTQQYDDSGRLIGHVDAYGYTIQYEHDIPNGTTSVTDRNGNRTIQQFDADGNLVGAMGPMGGITTCTYDEQGRRLTRRNPLGETERYVYASTNGALVAVVNALGQTNTFTYNARGQVISASERDGTPLYTGYDEHNNITNVVDATGTATTYAYNAQGKAIYSRDALGNEVHSEYDQFGNLLRSTNALGHVADYVYDNNNRIIQQVLTRTVNATVQRLTNSWSYDALGRVIEAIAPDGSSHKTIYNESGQIASTIDELGRVTTHQYDELARLVRITYSDGSTEGFDYDAEDRKVSATNRAGQVTRFVYDGLGRLVITLLPDGSSTTNYFNAASRLVATTDARGNHTWFGHDALGRAVATTNSLNQVSTFAYDARGNQITSTDALGRTTTNVFDLANRLLAVIHPGGSFNTTTYDALGRKTAETDQAGVSTWFGYDPLGRLTTVTNALGYVTRYEYNEVGEQTAQIDANGRITRYDYDERGRRTSRILPLGQSDLAVYDAVGNMSSYRDFNGNVTSYQYDILNRLSLKTPDPRLGEPPVSFGYNVLGQRTNMVDASGVTTYRYDERNRLIEKVTPQGALSYTYDPNGNVTSIQSSNPNGTSVAYEYDALNRLLAVNDGQLGRTAYTYDEVGNLRGFTYPNGVNTFYRYDSLNRLTNVTGGKLLDTLASYSYTLAPAGHRTSSTELNGRVANYAYDLLYRLTSETITGAPNGHNGTLEYSYDAVGNRLARNSNLPGILASGYAYDANDRLTSDLYDNNGNTRNAAVRDPASGLQQPVSDQYDFENRLINRDNGRIRIVYDGDGNRVRKTVTTATNVVTTFYLVDSLNPTGYPQVVEELTQDTADPLFSTPGVSRIYAWGHALLAQDRFNGSTWSESYYGYDGQSSVRYLTDTLGQVTDTYDYDAFGNLTARFSVYQTPTPNNYLYQGEHFDAELGLYYLRARYADPDRGRFWTMDSFEGFGSDPSSLHKYTFNHNDPLNRRDPSGHVSLTELVAVDTLAPMVSGMLRSLQQSFTQCNMLTAGLAGLQGAGIGAAVSAGITGLIQAFTGEFDAKAIAEAMAQGAEQGATEGFLLGLSPPAFMAYTGYQTFQAGLDMWNSFHDPNTPMWVKFMQGAGLAASVLPGVSPKLALKLRDLLKKFCFPAGTEVATAEGNKPIEEIREGDLVWAQSDQTGEIMLKRVKQVFVNVAAALVVLHCGTNTLEATPEHPLWIADQGWKAAGQIQVGDELFSLSGERLYVAAVRHKQGQFTVYNFEVEDFHSYFVGRVEVLGHNACVNAKHIFHGDVRKGKAKGFHHRGSIGHEGNARVVSEGPKNVQGAYSAQIEVRDPATGSWLRKTSTMFPDQWSRAQVLDEIQSVVASPTAAKWQSGVNTVVEGISPSGLTIRAYITPGGLIDSAHPVL